MEETNSDLDLFRHRDSSNKMKVEQERQKSKLLERYVDKIESQVKVQQNMMEMMSQAGSVYGGSVYGGSQYGSAAPASPPHVVRAANSVPPLSASKYRHDDVDQVDDDEDENVPGHHLARQVRRQRRNVEDDNKSHMSELTEERTLKQFDAAMMLYGANPQLRAAMARSPRAGPPAIIGIAEEDDNLMPGASDRVSSSGREKLGTISGSRGKRPPKINGIISSRSSPMTIDASPARSRPSLGRKDMDNSDAGSATSPKKMSVAQRARLQADRQSTPVRVRPNQTPVRGNKRDSASVNSQQSGGFFSKFGRRFEEAVDNSVLGVDFDDESEGSSGTNSYEGYESSRYANSAVSTDVDGGGSAVNYDMEEEKKMPDHSSVISATKSLSLADRQALQRAQQLKFLKEQGLIKKESDVLGGAGTDAQSVNSKSSRTAAKVTSL